MSGGSARTIRRYSVELWQDLVLHRIRKSTFQHLTVNWNFNVLEMALKTLHFVQGLSRTPLLIVPRYLPTKNSHKYFEKNKNLENRKSSSLTRQVKVSSFVSAGTVRWRRGSKVAAGPGQARGKGRWSRGRRWQDLDPRGPAAKSRGPQPPLAPPPAPLAHGLVPKPPCCPGQASYFLTYDFRFL